MEREDAIHLLEAIHGNDLVELAGRHGQKIWHEKTVAGVIERTLDKGWAGKTLERYLGLPPNSRREPNGGSWELKQASLKRSNRTGRISVKETVQITMLDRRHVVASCFEDSHILHKIGRMIVVARLYVSREETSSPIVRVQAVDLSALQVPLIYNQVKQDYDKIRTYLQEHDQVQTVSGQFIQIRTKGQKNSSSYAFYATPRFVGIWLGLNK